MVLVVVGLLSLSKQKSSFVSGDRGLVLFIEAPFAVFLVFLEASVPKFVSAIVVVGSLAYALAFLEVAFRLQNAIGVPVSPGALG